MWYHFTPLKWPISKWPEKKRGLLGNQSKYISTGNVSWFSMENIMETYINSFTKLSLRHAIFQHHYFTSVLFSHHCPQFSSYPPACHYHSHLYFLIDLFLKSILELEYLEKLLCSRPSVCVRVTTKNKIDVKWVILKNISFNYMLRKSR